MNWRHLPAFLALFLATISSFAQNSSVQGTVTDESGDHPIIAALVTLKKTGEPNRAVYTDDNGKFVFLNLNAGEYSLEIKAFNFTPMELNFTLASSDTRSFRCRLGLATDGNMGPVRIRGTAGKLDVGTPQVSIKPKEPFTNPGGLINTLALNSDVIKTRNGIQFPGRPEQTAVFNQGVSQLGPITPLTLNLGQVRTLAGGVPAMYGDFTGGAIEITTASTLGNSPYFSFQLEP